MNYFKDIRQVLIFYFFIAVHWGLLESLCPILFKTDYRYIVIEVEFFYSYLGLILIETYLLKKLFCFTLKISSKIQTTSVYLIIFLLGNILVQHKVKRKLFYVTQIRQSNIKLLETF